MTLSSGVNKLIKHQDKKIKELEEWREKARLFLPLAEDKILTCIIRAREEGDSIFLRNLKENLKDLGELLDRDIVEVED